MNEKMEFKDSVSASVTRGRQVTDRFTPKGSFTVELLDKNGNVKWSEKFDNTVVNDGKNKVLSVMFNGMTQITSWYIGLIDNSGYASSPVTDVMNSHAGWTEFTAYTEATRQEWDVADAASQQITNASPAVFNINATGSVRGIFVTSSSTKSGTTGTLWSTALFAASVAVANTDQIKITYTVQC